MQKFLMGVDEAGRGPLAGPVAVGVAMVSKRLDIPSRFPGLKDSKQLSQGRREELFAQMHVLEKTGTLRYIVVFSSSYMIDRVGIVKAISRALYKGVRALAPDPAEVCLLLDGLLHAPPEYRQTTIVRGDETEPIISLASIAAKVERDRHMCALAGKHPHYGFERHKGYGTELHYAAIAEHGLCDIHRRSFCKNI